MYLGLGRVGESSFVPGRNLGPVVDELIPRRGFMSSYGGMCDMKPPVNISAAYKLRSVQRGGDSFE